METYLQFCPFSHSTLTGQTDILLTDKTLCKCCDFITVKVKTLVESLYNTNENEFFISI